jgi:hypothetical protein
VWPPECPSTSNFVRQVTVAGLFLPSKIGKVQADGARTQLHILQNCPVEWIFIFIFKSKQKNM